MKGKLPTILLAITTTIAVACVVTIPRFEDSGVAVMPETNPHLLIRVAIVAALFLGTLIASTIYRQKAMIAVEFLIILSLTTGWFWLRSHRVVDNLWIELPKADGSRVGWYAEQGPGLADIGRDYWPPSPFRSTPNAAGWSLWIFPVQLSQMPWGRGYMTPTLQVHFLGAEFRMDHHQLSPGIGGMPPGWGWRVIVPHWMIVTALLASASLILLRTVLKSRRRAGFCQVCGYDLRATPDRCPECGTVATAT